MLKNGNGRGIDVMISWDTTGSMYPCFAEVSRKVKNLVRDLFTRVPELRVGIIVHGDYCDEGHSYVLRMHDLTNDRASLIDFVENVQRTNGGDCEECYELVLHTARSANWTAGKSRVLVMIGDDVPHNVSYPANVQRLDWVNEAKMLAESSISVYSVQCLNIRRATRFWGEVARLTGGLHLELNQFQYIRDLIVGITVRQESPEAFNSFESEVRSSGRYAYGVEVIFDQLSGRTPRARKPQPDLGLEPVDPARFQVFRVDGQPQIREFVESMGITFEKGRAFYPLVTRKELIQEKKEVVLEDLETGDMFSGAAVRERIGLPYGCRGEVSPWPLGKRYRLWVQSTSVNRVLRDPWFMYEVPEKA